MAVSSTECPCCGETKITWFDYPEGRIALCPRCRLQWALRTVAPENGLGLLATVNMRYMNPAAIDPPHYPPYVEFFARLEREKGPGPLRMLDIGCGNGVFMAEAARRGHVVNGIEMDLRLKAVIPPQVIDRVVFASAEEAVPKLTERYDVVTFWDSFEHMDDPFGVLEALRPVLAPDARIFIRVNNSHDIFNLATRLALAVAPNGLGRTMLQACFNLPDHAWNFSAHPMTVMMERRGWHTVHANVTETPAFRLTANPLLRLTFNLGYWVNRLIGGGKIGQYWVTPAPQRS